MSEIAGAVRLQDMSSQAVLSGVDRTAVGSDAANVLEALYLTHREAVFRYLRAISRDEDRALDLTAVTFERAFGELRAGREPGIGWLLRTARNAAIDADRRARAAVLFHWHVATAAPVAPSLEDQMLRAEQAARLHAGLQALPRSQRDAIALRYTSELTVREIAAVIGKSPSATQKLLDRGLARLKEALHDLA